MAPPVLIGFLAIAAFALVKNPPGDIPMAWDTAAGASSYTLYWSTQPVNVTTGKFDSPQSVNTSSTLAIVTLPTGSYFFAVTASGDGIESAYSNVALVAVPAPSD